MTAKRNGSAAPIKRRRDRTLHLAVPQPTLDKISKSAEKERRTLHAQTLQLVDEALAARDQAAKP